MKPEHELIARMGVRLYRAAMAAPIAPTKTERREIVKSCKGRASRLSVADAVAAVELAQHLRASRRQARAARIQRCWHGDDQFLLPLSERWTRHQANTMNRSLVAALDFYPVRGELSISLHDGDEITAKTTTEDEGRYSRSCRYRKISHHGEICLPRHGVTVSTADGVAMVLRYRRAVSHGGITATPGAIISRRGYALSAHEAWLVSDGELFAHGATRHAAIRALKAKRAALRRKDAPLTMDSIITPAMYQRITGACTEGTNAWLEAHGLARSSRGTVRQLLSMLNASDYGRERLAALVADAGEKI